MRADFLFQLYTQLKEMYCWENYLKSNIYISSIQLLCEKEKGFISLQIFFYFKKLGNLTFITFN